MQALVMPLLSIGPACPRRTAHMMTVALDWSCASHCVQALKLLCQGMGVHTCGCGQGDVLGQQGGIVVSAFVGAPYSHFSQNTLDGVFKRLAVHGQFVCQCGRPV
uniref:Uncharacterized protein n=1 Tax=Eutreptiella gymnastica TaxID=73025 RepID=A0A7S4CM30_9EUGL